MHLEVPNHHMAVTLRKRLQLGGKLVVPAHGPPVQDYGLWVSQEGGGIGIRPDKEGNFSGQGSSASLEIKVTYPTMGVVLFQREMLVAPTEAAGIGSIVLTDIVQVLDVVVTDAQGAPLVSQEWHIEGEGLETIQAHFASDEKGRLVAVFPMDAKRVKLSKRSGYIVDHQSTQTLDLTKPHSSLVFP